MSEIFTAATTVFSNIFGASGYVASLITLITANDFLLLGLGLMIAGAVCSYLARLIHTS